MLILMMFTFLNNTNKFIAMSKVFNVYILCVFYMLNFLNANELTSVSIYSLNLNNKTKKSKIMSISIKAEKDLFMKDDLLLVERLGIINNKKLCKIISDRLIEFEKNDPESKIITIRIDRGLSAEIWTDYIKQLRLFMSNNTSKVASKGDDILNETDKILNNLVPVKELAAEIIKMNYVIKSIGSGAEFELFDERKFRNKSWADLSDTEHLGLVDSGGIVFSVKKSKNIE